jgi:hypothetical protein
MERRKFDSLVPEFFRALGKYYEVNSGFFWSEVCLIAECMVNIEGYLTTLKGLGFEYDLDDLVYPLLKGFINSVIFPEEEESPFSDPQTLAFNSLLMQLLQVRDHLKQELEKRTQQLKNRELRP